MTTEASIRIGRVTCSDPPDYIEINIDLPRAADGSRVRVRVKMSLESFAQAITGRMTECEYEAKEFKPRSDTGRK